MKKSLLLLIVLFVAASGWADQLTDLLNDAGNTAGDTERLAAYDYILDVYLSPNNVDDSATLARKIRAITPDDKRLAAYDEAYRKEPPKPVEKPPIVVGSSVGKWKASSSVDAMTDKKSVVFWVPADSGENEWGNLPSLYIRSNDRGLKFFVDFDQFINTEGVQVTVRFDSESPETYDCVVSTDYTAAFFKDWEVLALLDKLLRAKTSIFRVSPYGANTITSVFDVRGLAAIVVKNNVKWW
ncbi:MAG: hypothetical protein NTV04_20440 [Deltaproteobacteria bacterium]|nr:hypothetical protein [Deltaproteobacteria bacterium]